MINSTLHIYHYHRQWREEREKLIQCIHLQQLELSQRSIAAHERAVDIAKVRTALTHHSLRIVFIRLVITIIIYVYVYVY